MKLPPPKAVVPEALKAPVLVRLVRPAKLVLPDVLKMPLLAMLPFIVLTPLVDHIPLLLTTLPAPPSRRRPVKVPGIGDRGGDAGRLNCETSGRVGERLDRAAGIVGDRDRPAAAPRLNHGISVAAPRTCEQAAI